MGAFAFRESRASERYSHAMISKKEVQHIAKLARLHLSEKEVAKMQKELSAILDYFNSLKKLDTAKIKLTPSKIGDLLKKEKAMREDKLTSQDPNVAQKLIELSPDKKGNYIKVKSVL